MACLVALAGCERVFAVSGVDVADAGRDAGPGEGAPACFGSMAFFRYCPIPLPVGELMLSSPIDTDGAGCTLVSQPPGPDVCVIAGHNITVDANFTVTVSGSHPLVLLATNDLVVNGVLDVSSAPARQGPAANDPTCMLASGVDQAGGSTGNGANEGAGGGPGGSFQGIGGTGGASDSGIRVTGFNAVGVPTFLRGGCRGSNGGNAFMTTLAGSGGASGGAVDLVAGMHIVVTGGVIALGAGGVGGPGAASSQCAGGGGGGSGGLIVLDAPSIMLTGSVLLAGGGGGGGGGNEGNMGDTGGRVDPTRPALAASGGNTEPTLNRSGGIGSAPNVDSGGPGMDFTGCGISGSSGGGGGGGGAGFIRLLETPTSIGTIIPSPS
jgi:hypothetical protein